MKDAAGQPLAGAAVAVAMQQHEFGFGSAVTGVRLRDNNPAHAMYKQKVEELFNIATPENDLKWPPWNRPVGQQLHAGRRPCGRRLARGADIRVRGHNIIWPGYNNLPTSVQTILDGAPLDANEQAALRSVINAHIDDIASQFAGDLAAWDVVNEAWDNHDVQDNLAEGAAAMVDWFQRTRANDPTAVLYLNDYNILSTGGSTNTPKQQFFYDTIQYLKDQGAPIGGIGFQGHFGDDSFSGPEQLWAILDRYAALGLDMQVTEFDVGTDDEQLQADYTRDFLTAMFAHEGVDDVVMWGFWEDAHFDPAAALFRSDWSIKPNGQAWLDLVKDQWWTDEQLASGAGGEAALRGFKGTYEITVTLDGKTVVVPATLTDGGLTLDVTLPVLGRRLQPRRRRGSGRHVAVAIRARPQRRRRCGRRRRHRRRRPARLAAPTGIARPGPVGGSRTGDVVGGGAGRDVPGPQTAPKRHGRARCRSQLDSAVASRFEARQRRQILLCVGWFPFYNARA